MRIGQFTRVQMEDYSRERRQRGGSGNSPHSAFCSNNCGVNDYAERPSFEDTNKVQGAVRVRSASLCSHQSNVILAFFLEKENDCGRESSTLNTCACATREISQVELTAPIKQTSRSSTAFDGGQQAHVSFASIPVLCAHPDDRFGDQSYLTAKIRFKPSKDHQPTPGRGVLISESSRNIAQSGERAAISTQRCSISPNSTNTEANCISLTVKLTLLVAKLQFQESATSQMMRPDRLLSTPASAVTKTQYTHPTFGRKKAPLISRRAIDFSHAKELASSTPPQQTGNSNLGEKGTCEVLPVGSQMRKLGSVNSSSSRQTNLSLQKGPTHSYPPRYQDQATEPSAISPGVIYRTRFGEEIVTQSPEVKQRATHLVNSILQQRANNSPALNSTNSPIRPLWNRPFSKCNASTRNHFTYQQNQTDRARRNGNVAMPKVSEVVINLKRCDPSPPFSKLSTPRPLETKKEEVDREVIRRTISVTNSGRSTIRDRVPRGQTRRLASMFDTMTEEAIAEMTSERARLQANASMRRNSSVPPQTPTRVDHGERNAFNALGKGSLDDSFLVERHCESGEGTRYISEVTFRTNRVLESSNDRPIRGHCRSQSLQSTQFVEVTATPDAHSINAHFDSVATTKRYFESQISATHRGPPSVTSTNEVHMQPSSITLKGANNNVEFGDDVFEGYTDHERIEAVRRPPEPIRSQRAASNGDACSMPIGMESARHYQNEAQQRASDVQRIESDHCDRPTGKFVLLQLHGKYANVYASSGDNTRNGEGEHGHVHTSSINTNALSPLHSTTPNGNLCDHNSNRCISHDYLCKEHMAPNGNEPRCEVVDNIAEVSKAFAFVDKEESFIEDADARYSRGGIAAHAPTNKPLGYSISMYRELARGHRPVPNSDMPARFSATTLNMPTPAEERVATYECMVTYVEESGDVVRSKRDSVTSNPLATSTPLEGSPASAMHSICGSTDHALNSSEISAITVSTACGNNYEQDYAAQVKRLNEAILVQEERLSQADAALIHAKKFSNFSGTLAELCIHREVLLCRERHLALRRELERIKMMHAIKKRIPELSPRTQNTFDVSSITIFLNRNFCIRNIDEGSSYAFVALLKAGEQIYATEAITLMDSRVMRVSSVKFNEPIRFTNLPVDLAVSLEIYALKVHEVRSRIVDDRSCAKLRNRARTLLSPLRKANVDTSIVNSSQFTLCGSVVLNREAVGTQRFYLDNAEYPLEGTVEVRSTCAALPPIIETTFRGFLTMYEVISDLGSWARYWAVMRRGVVYFWKYPDDEAAEKPALAFMDLTSCTDKRIELAAIEVCSRPHTFSLDLLVPSPSTAMDKKRVLLSADTKEQCIAWIDAINETLEILRA
uniref:PH domain-containing protein n=1 Tax=Ascaris lumbricoides TaxID=6252 RepID=A0A9J2PBD1_ASCLU